jgi:hypothetical protein
VQSRQIISASRPADEIADQCYDEQNDRDPEQKPRSFHGRACYAAKSEQRGDESDYEKDDGIVQKIAHEYRSGFNWFDNVRSVPAVPDLQLDSILEGDVCSAE